MNELDYLRQLETAIWRIDERLVFLDGRHQKRGIQEFRRALTLDEWTRVLLIIENRDLMVTLDNWDFGFSIGVCLYLPDNATFPGVIPKAEYLFSMKRDHIPPELMQPEDRSRFDISWDLFSPLANRPKNLEHLRWHGLPEPREKGHYDY